MKKIKIGILLGMAAGAVDLIPMLIQGLSWDANISAFMLWCVSGFLIAASSLKIRSALKGVLVSFLVLLPSAVLIGWKEPVLLIPVFVMTAVLGSLLGFLIDKYAQ
ncbi:hypothetical protein COY95_00435 [Candidatus Woesearchaeota archaeon CG_4_10_14_0_8_um_filter_47_5]|nr:MAG: hypothetical protein COY95_00435 [Candidatus Woesearchaeota archaeon CG_4_10_14_0_8_um_filter_47_5]